jgi:hypothetical protein
MEGGVRAMGTDPVLSDQPLREETLQQVGEAVSFFMREPPSDFQEAGSKPHQFWFHGEVPVGICHMPVPQEGRQNWQAPLDILVGPIPLHQCADGKSVPKIVQPRTLAILRPA